VSQPRRLNQELREEAHGSLAPAPVEVIGILFGVPGSLERYSRAIRTQRHIPALHRRGHIAISRTAAVTTRKICLDNRDHLSTNHPTPQALTLGRAQRAQSRPTCIEAVPVLSGCRSLFTPAPVYFMM
jgi:hypothetical protein